MKKPRKKPHTKNAVAYQNKDIASKVLGDGLIGKSFSVYGRPDIKIVDVLPTNLPSIEANELRLDHLFRLADESLAIIDYESTFKQKSLVKYLSYIVRVIKRMFHAKQDFAMQKLRVIVIYTGNVKKGSTVHSFDVGAVQFRLEEIFLTDIDGKAVYQDLKEEIDRTGFLSDESLMQLMFLPLTEDEVSERKIMVRQVVDLAVAIQNDEQEAVALAGILTFSDKIIDKDDAKKIKEVMMMTKVVKLIWDEALTEGLTEGHSKGLTEGLAKGLAEGHSKGLTEGLTKGLAEGHSKGLTEGLTKSIIELLSENGTVSDKLKAEIQAQTDEEILKSWLKAASKSESIEAFQEMIKA